MRDMGADHDEAVSSREGGINNGMNMENFIHGISADKKLKEKAVAWESNYTRRKQIIGKKVQAYQ